MKKILLIFCFAMIGFLGANPLVADDGRMYIDDLYFTPEQEAKLAIESGDLQPKYNPNAKEIEWIIEETDSIK